MELIDLAPILAIPAVGKVIDLYRQAVLERDARKTAFTVGAWIIGTGLVFVVTQSSVGPELPSLNWADLMLAGIGLGSTASYVHDFANRGETTVLDTAVAAAIEHGFEVADEVTIDGFTTVSVDVDVED